MHSRDSYVFDQVKFMLCKQCKCLSLFIATYIKNGKSKVIFVEVKFLLCMLQHHLSWFKGIFGRNKHTLSDHTDQ